jgi:hypothetical protein
MRALDMKISKFGWLALLALAIQLLVQPVAAQTEPEAAENVLVFSHTKKPKSDTVKVGTRVELAVKGKIFLHRGKIEAIQDSAVVLKGKEYLVKDLKAAVVVKFRWVVLAEILVYVSLLLVMFGIWAPMLAAAYLAKHPLVPRTGKIDRLAKVLGVKMGFILLVLGDLLLIFRGKSYSLRRKWKASVQKRPRSQQ